jgi:Spy/CpxP family protein refolding chaperone
MSVRYLRFALALAFVAPALAAAQAAPAAPAARAAHDQHGQHGKPALDAELTEHFKGIALTDAQVRQVLEIKAKHHAAMDDLRKNPGGRDSVAVHTEVQKHMAAEHAEFMAMLTPEQRKTFEENMKGHHAPSAARPAMDHGAHDMGKAPGKAPAPATRKP